MRSGKVDDLWDFRGELRRNLDDLKQLMHEESVEYAVVQAIVREIVDCVPTPSALLSPGVRLYRARVNNRTRVFTSKRELSYHPDPSAIVTFGRANIPHQAVFYASDDSSTALHETVEAAFPTDARAEGALALGVWEVMSAIPVGLVAFSDAAWQRRTSRRNVVDTLEKLLERDFSEEAKTLVVEALTYFAERFAVRVENPLEYLPTAAYFNCILRPQHPDVSLRTSNLVGLCYPSVKADLAGDNIALLPEAVDASLALVDLTEFRFTKDGDQVRVEGW